MLFRSIAAPPVAGHRLQTRRLSSCGSRAQPLRGMWDLPRPGLEPVSPALAGRLSTTAPPGKPLIDIYRPFHPKTTEYTFFSSARGTFSRIDHILGHKSSLTKFKKIEIVSSLFSDHNAMRLDINYRKKSVKNTNTWRLNYTLLNSQEITEEIKEEIKKYLETNDSENMMTQNLWEAAKAVVRGKFIAIQSYLKKQETSQINNLTLHLKQLEKEQKTPKISRRKEIIKIRSEINEKEMKKTIAKINKTKSLFFEKINKIDKPLARLIKKKREKTQ